MKKIAVTGGISCGKSIVCQQLAELGAHVADADEIVHQLLSPDTEVGKKVVDLVGPDVIVDNQLDRSRIAKKVFLNPRLLRSLEEIIHPKVYEEIENEYQKAKIEGKTQLFVAEIPLLFESGGEKYFDTTLAIIADKEVCWNRYRRATGHEREDFNRRLARQLPPEKKAEIADFVIRNDGSLDDLQKQVDTFVKELTTKKDLTSD